MIEKIALSEAMSTLDVINDFNNMFAEASSNKAAKVSKSNAAYALGGIYPQGTISDDFNNYRKTGMYIYEQSSNVANAPAKETCLVVVFSNVTYAVQFAFSLNTSNIYYRRALLYNNTFYAWKTI